MEVETRPDLAHAFDTIGARYDDVFHYKPGQIAATDWVVSQLSGAHPMVIDIGCGTGLPTARKLADAGCGVVGVDISTVMIDMAQQNVPEGIFVERDLTDLSGLHPAGQRFDAGMAFFSLLVLTRAGIEEALDAIHEVLRPRAPFALGMVEGDSDFLLREFLGTQVPLTAYPRDQLRDLLVRHRFDVLELTAEDWRGAGDLHQTHLYARCVTA